MRMSRHMLAGLSFVATALLGQARANDSSAELTKQAQ